MTIALIPPSGQQSQTETVTDNEIVLDFIPAPDTVAIDGYVRMYEGDPAAGQFKVTPGSATLEFNDADEEAELEVLYICESQPGVTEDKVNEIIDEVNTLAGDSPDLIITTKGDLIAGNTSGVAVRLAVGTNDQVLTADSAQPNGVKWAAAAGFANPMTTMGDLIIGGASGAAARLPVGTSGQLLFSNGTDISWQTIPGNLIIQTETFNVTGHTFDQTITATSGLTCKAILSALVRGPGASTLAHYVTVRPNGDQNLVDYTIAPISVGCSGSDNDIKINIKANELTDFDNFFVDVTYLA